MNLLLLHATLSAGIGVLFAGLAPGARPHHERIMLAAIFFLLSLLLPVAGPLGIFFGVLQPLRRARLDQELELSFSGGARLAPVSAPKARPMRSYGWVSELIRNSRNPAQKFAAILACRNMKDKDSVPILREALHDAEDDVRLLAYSYLYKKEDEINKRIFYRSEAFQKGFEDPGERARHAAELAYDYWELYYLELAQGPVAQYLLNRARGYAEIALSHMRQDAALYFTYGRILLHLKIYAASEQMLRRAMDLGYSEKTVISYLAETAFERRQMDKVRRYVQLLKALGTLHDRERQLVEFWGV